MEGNGSTSDWTAKEKYKTGTARILDSVPNKYNIILHIGPSLIIKRILNNISLSMSYGEKKQITTLKP